MYTSVEIKSEEPYSLADMPPTIDAFTIQKKKTRNVWEAEFSPEDISHKFRSIVMQSPPLDSAELTQLDKGYAHYR